MKITQLRYEEIDFEAYNRCIESSPFGAIYAMSWYLDATSPRWELLMANNYQYVMPLPVKQKWGMKYLTQPLFCQQLGVFSTQQLTSDILKSFIAAIPYFFYHIQLNVGNTLNCSHLKLRDNYELNLNKPYPDIRKNYGKNFVRNIKKAETENLQLEKDTDWDTFLRVIKNNCGNRPIRYSLPVFDTIRCIRKNATIEIWSVRNETQAILSSTIFFRWENRFYYMLPVSTPEGKEKQSMSFLLDQFVQAHSGEEIILDFEGSSIPSIARFYKNTGSVHTCYPVITKPKMAFDFLSYLKKYIFK